MLTCGEAAALAGTDSGAITRAARSGRLPYIRTPGGHRRYRPGEVRALMAAGGLPASRPRRRRVPGSVLTDLQLAVLTALISPGQASGEPPGCLPPGAGPFAALATNAQIAARTGLTPAAVRQHLVRMYRAFGLTGNGSQRERLAGVILALASGTGPAVPDARPRGERAGLPWPVTVPPRPAAPPAAAAQAPGGTSAQGMPVPGVPGNWRHPASRRGQEGGS